MASLPQSLAEWRGREGVALDQLARALRVEATTLERIEAGEVAPGNELRERIGRTIDKGFSHSLQAPTANRPAHGDARPAAVPAARAHGTGGAARDKDVPSVPPHDYGCSCDEFPTASGTLPAIDRDGSGGVAASLGHEEAAAPPVYSKGSPNFTGWLKRCDGGDWHIEGWWDGWKHSTFSIDEARQMAAELGQLVAIHDATPAGFARAFAS